MLYNNLILYFVNKIQKIKIKRLKIVVNVKGSEIRERKKSEVWAEKFLLWLSNRGVFAF